MAIHFHKPEHFARNQSGGIAVMAALILTPLTMAMGAAIDLARFSYLHTRISLALDAAALAGERFRNIDQTGMANSFFTANFPVAIFGVLPTINIKSSSTSVSTIVSASGNMPVAFSKVFGISNMAFSITSQATNLTLGQDNIPLPPQLSYYSPYLSMLPEGSTNSQSYVSNIRSPNLIMQETRAVTFTFIRGAGSYNNSLGYYTIDPTGRITNVKLAIPNAKDTSGGGPLVAGSSTFSMGTIAFGTQIGFFLLTNAYNLNNFTNSTGSNYINPNSGQFVFSTLASPGLIASAVIPASITTTTTPYLYYYAQPISTPIAVQTAPSTNNGIFHSIASAALNTVNLNASKQQQAITYGNVNGTIRLGFEDINLTTPGKVSFTLDADFNDVIIDINVGTLTSSYLFNNSVVALTDTSQY